MGTIEKEKYKTLYINIIHPKTTIQQNFIQVIAYIIFFCIFATRF